MVTNLRQKETGTQHLFQTDLQHGESCFSSAMELHSQHQDHL
jgi:hypothetical protein